MFEHVRWRLLSVMRGRWYSPARRWYRLWLLTLMFLVYIFTGRAPFLDDLYQPARVMNFARAYVEAFLIQHYGLLLAVMPAFAAETITEEKNRGSLDHLLTTALGPHEIILTKWLAQIILLVELAVISLPVFCLFGVLAGLELPAFFAFAGSTLLLLAVTSAAGLLASVWCRTTTTAVFSVYAVAVLTGAAVWHLGWLDFLRSPFEIGAFYPADPVPANGVLAAGVWVGFTVMCLLLAGWRLRPSYMKQRERANRPGRRWLRRPPVSSIPLRWKERYAGVPAVLPFLHGMPRWLLLTVVIGITPVLYTYFIATPAAKTFINPDTFFLVIGIPVALAFGLGIAVRSAAAISGERERRSWEVLLVTPLELKQIVRGKLWGIMDSARPYLFAYLVSALACALTAGPLAVFCVLFWWGWAWLLMYFLGAVGIENSAGADNSWRSLFDTLTAGTRVGFMIIWPVIIVGTVMVVTMDIEVLLGPGMVVVGAITAIFLLAKTEVLLIKTEEHIAGSALSRGGVQQKSP